MKERIYLDRNGKTVESGTVDKKAGILYVKQGIVITEEDQHDKEYIVSLGTLKPLGRISCYYSADKKKYDSYYIDKKTAVMTDIERYAINEHGFGDEELAQAMQKVVQAPYAYIMVEWEDPELTKHKQNFFKQEFKKIEERFKK